MSPVGVVAIVIYAVGWLVFFYAIVPSLVQGPPGAWLYRACVLQPRSWPLGIPFVIAAFTVAFTWPLALVVWLLTGRRPPPLIATQSLLDHYGVPYEGEGPALSRIPTDIGRRLGGHRTTLPTEFGSSVEFWRFYLPDHS
jgi:hypothetical protein